MIMRETARSRSISVLSLLLVFNTFLFMGGCAEADYVGDDQETGVSLNASLVKDDGTKDDIPSGLSGFHLFTFDSGGDILEQKSGDRLSDINKLSLVNKGTYNVCLFANLNEDAFDIPTNISYSSAAFTLKENVEVPDLYWGNSAYEYSEENSDQPSVCLSHVACSLKIAVDATMGDLQSVTATVRNMYNKIRIDNKFSGKVNKTIILNKSASDAKHFEASALVFPTNGESVIDIEIKDNDGNILKYSQKLDQNIESGKQLSISFNQKTVNTIVSVTKWQDWTNEAHGLGAKQLVSRQVTLSNMPSDFTPISALISIDKMGTQINGSINKNVLTCQLPSNYEKIYAIKFYNAENDSFTAYFGNTGIEGFSLKDISELSIPNAPAIGSYFGYGCVWHNDATSGWRSYNVKVAVSFDPPLVSLYSATSSSMADLDTDGYSEWRIPTEDELQEFFSEITAKDKIFNTQFKEAMRKSIIPDAGAVRIRYYWTSSKSNNGLHKVLNPINGAAEQTSSDASYSILPIRDL